MKKNDALPLTLIDLWNKEQKKCYSITLELWIYNTI